MMRLIELIRGRGRAQEVSGLNEKPPEEAVIGEARSLAWSDFAQWSPMTGPCADISPRRVVSGT